jgi:hypothetical protein
MMRYAMVLLFCLITRSLSFPQSSFVQRDLEALAILSRCTTTMVAEQIPNLHAQGTVTYTDARIPSEEITVESKGVDKVKVDLVGQTDMSFVMNSGTGHYLIGSGRKEASPWVIAYFRPEHIPAAFCSLDLARSMQMARYIGIEAIGRQTAYHIEFSAQPRGNNQDNSESLISEFHIYIDTTSFMVIKTKSFAFAPDSITNHSDWEVFYSDYRNISGIQMPFQIDYSLAQHPFKTVRFKQITAGSQIPDTDFSN